LRVVSLIDPLLQSPVLKVRVAHCVQQLLNESLPLSAPSAVVTVFLSVICPDTDAAGLPSTCDDRSRDFVARRYWFAAVLTGHGVCSPSSWLLCASSMR